MKKIPLTLGLVIGIGVSGIAWFLWPRGDTGTFGCFNNVTMMRGWPMFGMFGFWLLVILLVFIIFNSPMHRSSNIQTLEQRLSSGDISVSEYHTLKNTIERND